MKAEAAARNFRASGQSAISGLRGSPFGPLASARDAASVMRAAGGGTGGVLGGRGGRSRSHLVAGSKAGNLDSITSRRTRVDTASRAVSHFLTAGRLPV